jgi:hypothetical protein
MVASGSLSDDMFHNILVKKTPTHARGGPQRNHFADMHCSCIAINRLKHGTILSMITILFSWRIVNQI